MDEIIQAAKAATLAALKAAERVANGQDTDLSEQNAGDTAAAFTQAAQIAMAVVTYAVHNQAHEADADTDEEKKEFMH